ncbi:hypothetical protein SKAU_G00029390 [Synaphobranchus kaupii]|uniref:Uncharacterized protein n=1 Tax=Synaphobranchus kaupii TaxID=118154 RepID=A0A9Q1GEM8_SYNKA|nr:hypothetical protein SKAU_G00029390 [Synaphobranchus kaupii]
MHQLPTYNDSWNLPTAIAHHTNSPEDTDPPTRTPGLERTIRLKGGGHRLPPQSSREQSLKRLQLHSETAVSFLHIREERPPLPAPCPAHYHLSAQKRRAPPGTAVFGIGTPGAESVRGAGSRGCQHISSAGSPEGPSPTVAPPLRYRDPRGSPAACKRQDVLTVLRSAAMLRSAPTLR